MFEVRPCCLPRCRHIQLPSQCPDARLGPGNLEGDLHRPDEDASSPSTPIDGLLSATCRSLRHPNTACHLPRYISDLLHDGFNQCTHEYCGRCCAGWQLHIQCADSIGELVADSQYHAERGTLSAMRHKLELTIPRRKSTKQKATTHRHTSSYTVMPILFYRSCRLTQTGTSLRTGKRSMQQRRPCIVT